jgi:hypothetical protein
MYQRVVAHGHGYTQSWLSSLAPGRLEAVQCDFAVMLSPDMFGQFVMPDLQRTVDYFDYALYHLDGVCQLRFIDQLQRLQPALAGIQWNPETTQRDPLPWLDTFRDLRRRGFVLHIFCKAQEAEIIARTVGPDGLLLSLPTFDSEADALAAIERIEQASQLHTTM